MNRLRFVFASLILLTLALGACQLVPGMLQAQANYGAECNTDAECTGGTVCLDTGRTEGKKCVAGPAGPAGSDCVSAFECQAGLRCGLASKKCERGGLGLPECDSDDDCGSGKVCRDAHCATP